MLVLSTLLYANETWALPKQQLHRLEVFQMKCLRKICKVSLKDKIINEIILGLVQCCKSLKYCQPQDIEAAGPLGWNA